MNWFLQYASLRKHSLRINLQPSITSRIGSYYGVEMGCDQIFYQGTVNNDCLRKYSIITSKQEVIRAL